MKIEIKNRTNGTLTFGSLVIEPKGEKKLPMSDYLKIKKDVEYSAMKQWAFIREIDEEKIEEKREKKKSE
jgi:hypothetical protein